MGTDFVLQLFRCINTQTSFNAYGVNEILFFICSNVHILNTHENILFCSAFVRKLTLKSVLDAREKKKRKKKKKKKKGKQGFVFHVFIC